MENIKELQEKLESIKKANVKKCSEKINEVLKEYDCAIITTVQCVLNGEVVHPMIVSN